MNSQVDHPLTIKGWNVGFNKIGFTKLLQSELSLGLSDAKKMTDRVLNKELVELNVTNQDYVRMAKLATDLGAVVLAEGAEAEHAN